MYVKLFYSKISPTPKPKCFIKLNHILHITRIYKLQSMSDYKNKQEVKSITQRGGGKIAGLKNEELFVQFINIYFINQSQIIWEASIYSQRCTLSDNFLALKRQKKSNAPMTDQSKTDAIIEFKGNAVLIHKISLKKGAGRPTSSNVSETYALMYIVYYDKHSNNKALGKLLEELFKHLPDGIITSVYKVNQLKKDNNSDPEFVRARKEYLQWKDKFEICNDIIWKEMKQHHEYVVDLFKECLSGRLKFGNNEGTADFVIDIDVEKDGIQEGKYTTIPLTYDNEKLSEYINKLISITNCPFATKSSRPNSNSPYKIWSRFL